MADAVATQVILDGKKKTILKFTNLSDGTGEAAVAKVDVSGLSPVPAKVSITRIWFLTDGMSVNVLFDATTNVIAAMLPAGDSGELDFRSFGGVPNNAGAGVTGDILFTTVGHVAGDTYTVILELTKSF